MSYMWYKFHSTWHLFVTKLQFRYNIFNKHFYTKIFFLAYIQQVGRAGRSGDECVAVLYFNNSDLGRQGVTEGVREYCRNDTKCRKFFINSYFGFKSTDTEYICNKCDVCHTDLKSGWEFAQPLTLEKRGMIRNAISMYVQTIELLNISELHVEKLVFNAEFYMQPSSIVQDFSFDDSIAATLSSIICQSINGPQS